MRHFSDAYAALRRKNKGQYALLAGCSFFSVLLITAYVCMMRSSTILSVLPEGGDSRKQVMMVFVLAVIGCAVFTTYAAGLFFRQKSRETGVFLALGVALGFSGGVPWGRFGLFTLISWAVSMMVYALQQGLSLYFANQAVALVCGISGSFLGILSMLFPPALIRLVPWGYYGLLSLVGMDWNETTRVTRFYWQWPMPLDLALLLVWAAVFLAAGRTLFVKKEV